jgi:multidrug efflux pump subunit AcrA (membrane-fusion protein)
MKKNLLVTVSSNFSQMRRDELAFLPAALEIIETPPSPLSRVLGLTISAFAVCTITWAALGHLDIVSVASGKIVTRARTQIVQASETSVVDQILVEPGQKVNQWDPLIQFDTKTLLAEIERAGEELDQARLDEARLEAFLNPAQEIKLSGITGISLDKIDRAWSQLTSQKLERASKLAALRQEHEKQKSELESARVLLRKAEDILPLSKSRNAGKS